MKSNEFIVRQWRHMRWIWLAILMAAPVVLIINFVDASSSSDPLPWMDIPLAIGIVLGGTGLMWLARRWFNFMIGHEACMWRGKS
jgi:hypothetical protein